TPTKIAAQQRRTGALARALAVAQDAETRARLRNQTILVHAALQVIAAVAEKHEVAALHPVEQVARFADLVARERRRIALERGDDRAHSLAHRPPVVDRYAHVRERRLDITLQIFDLRRIGLPVDLVELPGFGVRGLRSVGAYVDEPSARVAPGFEHRMHDQV